MFVSIFKNSSPKLDFGPRPSAPSVYSFVTKQAGCGHHAQSGTGFLGPSDTQEAGIALQEPDLHCDFRSWFFDTPGWRPERPRALGGRVLVLPKEACGRSSFWGECKGLGVGREKNIPVSPEAERTSWKLKASPAVKEKGAKWPEKRLDGVQGPACFSATLKWLVSFPGAERRWQRI